MPAANRTLADEAGFTLIEMMVVLIVLAILSTTVILGTGSFQHGAADARGKVNYRLCKTAKAASLAEWGTEMEYRRYIDNAADPC